MMEIFPPKDVKMNGRGIRKRSEKAVWKIKGVEEIQEPPIEGLMVEIHRNSSKSQDRHIWNRFESIEI